MFQSLYILDERVRPCHDIFQCDGDVGEYERVRDAHGFEYEFADEGGGFLHRLEQSLLRIPQIRLLHAQQLVQDGLVVFAAKEAELVVGMGLGDDATVEVHQRDGHRRLNVRTIPHQLVIAM